MTKRLFQLFYATAGLATLAIVTPLGAEEPADLFLQQLRAAGYHDMALEYLDRMKTSPLAAEEFKPTIALEQGATLVEQTRVVRDPAVKEQLLEQAKTRLDTFVSQQPEHPKIEDARRYLRTILFERAKIIVGRAKQADDPAEHAKLMGEARESFAAAREAYNRHEETIKAELHRLQDLPAAQRNPGRVDQLRGEFVETKLAAAAITYELAGTIKDNPEEYTKLLDEAAEGYAEIAKKYRRFLGGMFAVFYEGRCLQDLGRLKEALARYEKIFDEPNQPGAFQTLRTMTIKCAVECWVTDEIDQLDLALSTGQEWAKTARPNDRLSMDGLALQMELARANLKKAEGANRDERLRYIRMARRFATAVSKAPGRLQAEARELLSQIRGEGEQQIDLDDVSNFSEAQAAAQRALEEIKATETALGDLRKQFGAATEQQRDEIQQQMSVTEETAVQQRTMALATLRRAIELAEENTSPDTINALRYRMSYVYYVQQQFFDAAVVAEHVIQFYPNSGVARMCGEIAMAAYQQLYTLNQTDDKRFETDRLVAVADRIVENWPNTPESEQALLTLVNFMVLQGNLDLAQSYLEKFPADSANRASAELTAGRAIWAKYLRKVRASSSENTSPPADTESLEKTKATAQAILTSGVDRLKSKGPSAPLIRAMLALAQIYVDTGQADAALALLNDPENGPKTLVDEGHEVTKAPGIAQEVLKTTLRAHIGALAAGGDANQSIQQAEAVMDQLQQAVGNTPEGQRQLVVVYFALARDLRTQVKLASPPQRPPLIRGFEAFLDRVYAGANELNVLYRVADTLFNLAQGMPTDASGGVSPAARALYEKALTAFQGIVDRIDSGQLQANPKVAMQIQLRNAKCHRGLGNFDKAAEAFAEVLTDNEMLLDVQIEAAESFQSGGAAGDSTMYRKAIVGDHLHPTEKSPVIWGWARLANVVSRQMQGGPEKKAKFGAYFYEARLNVAKCRFGQAKLASGDERDELMQKAKSDIVKIAKFYPDLGGEAWRQQYDEFLKKIQQELGEKPEGLAQLTAPATR